MSGKKISILCGTLAIVALVVAFTFAPGQVDKVLAQAGTVVYNLYATDGYYELPDGQPLYMYGFIGGRQATPFTYQTSCIPGKKDKITGLAACAGSTNEYAIDPLRVQYFFGV